jgi:hypothetical protein
MDAAGVRLDTPFELNLWETGTQPGQSLTIVAPVDPAEVDVDALALL